MNDSTVAVIGPSIFIKGEVNGSEDLLIEGRVEGTISLAENTVTIGESAEIEASVFAKTIRVEGGVTGDLNASEQVIVRSSGKVHGNISAPRLTLEDGARLKGSIDTEPNSASETNRASSTRVSKSVVSETKSSSTTMPQIDHDMNGKNVNGSAA